MVRANSKSRAGQGRMVRALGDRRQPGHRKSRSGHQLTYRHPGRSCGNQSLKLTSFLFLCLLIIFSFFLILFLTLSELFMDAASHDKLVASCRQEDVLTPLPVRLRSCSPLMDILRLVT